MTVTRALSAQSNRDGAPTRPIGFRVIHAVDRSRPPLDKGSASAGDAGGRQVDIRLWYPATACPPSKRLSIVAYLAAGHVGGSAGSRPPLAEALATDGFTDAAVARMLAHRQAACPDVPTAPGRAPIVALVHGSIADHLGLAEAMAARGLVVISFPSQGAFESAYRLSAVNLEAMTVDLQFALGVVRGLPNARDVGTVIVGVSNGSHAAVSAAMRDPRVSGIVSLDGTIGEGPVGALALRGPLASAWRVLVPTLHLYAPDNPFIDFRWLRELRYAPRTLLRFPGTTHDAFSRGYLAGIGGDQDSSLQHSAQVFACVRDVVVDFAIARTTEARETIVPPPSCRPVVDSTERLPALPRSPGEVEVRALASEDTIRAQRTIAAWAARRAHDAQPLPHELFSLGMTSLGAAGRWSTAIMLGELFVQSFPQSARAAMSYANALNAAGRAGDAETIFERVLVLAEQDDLDPFTRARLLAQARAALARRPPIRQDGRRW